MNEKKTRSSTGLVSGAQGRVKRAAAGRDNKPVLANSRSEEPAPEETRGVAAVNRAIRILNVFDSGQARLSLTEIANRTGFFKSTVLRLADSLLEYGLLERDKNNQFYLGKQLIRLGALAQRSWASSDEILSALQQLTEETGESATFYVRQGDGRLALFRVDSPRSVRDNIKAGDVLPLDRGAAGHVLAKASTRSAGFRLVVSRGERDPEVSAVAGPIYSGDRLIGALSVSGPTSRITQAKIRAVSTVLSQACARLSERLS